MPHPFIEVNIKSCENCENRIERALSKRDGFESPQHYYKRRFCSKDCAWMGQIGVPRQKEMVEKMRASLVGKPTWNKGKPFIKLRGVNHPNWKGGITQANKAARSTIEYKNWRRNVFERDDYTCQECGIRGVYLEADHIKPFALFKELRTVLENGRTLCKDCHRKTETYKGRTRSYCLTI